ncbi:DUF1311 domain-containing protein [Paenibacillus albiflavus]|uniref:DUF1311 domain-containing protein n=1 Tax=Paenibacillus albiflavus TaxID=2545760 RepID=A0A4R4ELG5_9BACL|nr:lysozyme inhibitor LprI family protein [Paenibacillus albiflavus]TCZ79291.1 DUF1311 domain-containing protein [Paenibacillus albiflavus]
MNSKKIIMLILVSMIVLSGCADKANVAAPTPSNSSSTSVNTQQPQSTLNDKEANNDAVKISETQVGNDDKTTYYGTYGLFENLPVLTRSNLIDQDYKQESDAFQNSTNFSMGDWIQLEGKYTDIWDKELNTIYKTVLAKLNQEQKDLLIASQKGWLQNHLKESEFVESTFQSDSEYNIGSQGRVNEQIAIKNRIKERTLQLFEYDYMLGGTSKVIYNGK